MSKNVKEDFDWLAEANQDISDMRVSIDKLKYDLGLNLSEESVYAIKNQISWYEGQINFVTDTIKEFN